MEEDFSQRVSRILSTKVEFVRKANDSIFIVYVKTDDLVERERIKDKVKLLNQVAGTNVLVSFLKDKTIISTASSITLPIEEETFSLTDTSEDYEYFHISAQRIA